MYKHNIVNNAINFLLLSHCLKVFRTCFSFHSVLNTAFLSIPTGAEANGTKYQHYSCKPPESLRSADFLKEKRL